MHEPIAGALRYLLKRARFFEQMGRARDDVDLAFAFHLRARLLVQFDDDMIFAADHEQRRRFPLRNAPPRKTRSPPTQNESYDFFCQFCGSDYRRTPASARSEIADRQVARLFLLVRPLRRVNESLSKQADVE